MSLEGQGIDSENQEAHVSGLATHPRTNGSRELDLQDQHPFTNAPIAAVQIPESPSVGANDKRDADQLQPQESAASVSRNPPDLNFGVWTRRVCSERAVRAPSSATKY